MEARDELGADRKDRAARIGQKGAIPPLLLKGMGRFSAVALQLPRRYLFLPFAAELYRYAAAVTRKPTQSSPMPRLIDKPTVITASGNKPKAIEEYVGRANTGTDHVSVACMSSPAGWHEPGQQPEFEEITVVLKGMLHVEYESGVVEVRAGQAVVTRPGEWVRYSTPEPGGAEYISICLPAFSAETVHRDQSTENAA